MQTMHTSVTVCRQSQWVYSTFNDPSSNPAMAIPPLVDNAQDRAQGVSGSSSEFIKMVPDNVFHTYIKRNTLTNHGNWMIRGLTATAPRLNLW